MIKLVCDKNRAFFRETEKLTSGSVGVTINFVFSPEWDGLLKTAVFDAGEAKIDVVLTSESCEVPPEVLACPGKQLSVGVFGELPDKTLVIPTIYAEAGIIRPGASPSGMSSAPPTPSWPEQVQAIAIEAKEAADSVRSDAAAGKFAGPAGADGGWYTPMVTQPDAITMRVSFSPSKEDMPDVEPKDIILPAGGGSGGSGGSGEDGGYYAPYVDDEGNLTWTASKTDMPAVDGANIKGPKGDTGAKGDTGSKGDKGEKGADGKSAYQYAVEGGFTGTEAEFAAKLAQEKFASPNALTFTGAVTGSYDGSAPLNVKIPSGGSGGSDAWSLIDHVTAEDAAISYEIPMQPGAKEYGIYWDYTQPSGGSTPKRSIMVDSSLAQFGVMYRCSTNEKLFVRVFKGPSNILATGQAVVYAAQRFSNGGTNIGSGTDFPAMTLTTDIACATTEIWVYWR